MGLDPRDVQSFGPGAQASANSDLERRLAILERALVSTRGWVPGDVKATGKPTPDAGWLLCDGSLVSRTTYAALFAAVGVTFGSGDGSTTFGLPDLRGRVPVGSGPGPGLTARTHGFTFGAETVAADLAPHTHTGTTGAADRSLSHSHGIIGDGDRRHDYAWDGVGGAGNRNGLAAGRADSSYDVAGGSAAASPDHLHAFTTNSAGAGGGHANVQPSLALNFVIRT